MSKVLHFKPPGRNRQVTRERACLWVVRLSAGASEAELRELHAWLDEHPAHVRALMDAASTWDQVSVLSELSDIFPLQEYLTPRSCSRRKAACAAVAAIALLFFLQGPLRHWLDEVWPGAAMPLSYETRVGERITVNLQDGSEVILNTNSRIEVAFSETSRDIILRRGEGHFSVATDPARPFRVHADRGVVEAVGTAFTVQQTLQQSLEITVLEGVVNFTPTPRAVPADTQAPAPAQASAAPLAAAETIPLRAGESVEVNDEDAVVQKEKVQPNELESRLAWRHGMLLFQGDPLGSVIEEVSRYTAIRIEVEDAVRDIPVLGYFRTGDIEGILLTMQDTFHIEVERLSDAHIVLKAGNQGYE